MDLDSGKPNDNQGAKWKRIHDNSGRGIKMKCGDRDKRDCKSEDAEELLPKRILRSASRKLPLATLPAVKVKKPENKAASTSRKSNATVTASKDNVVKKKTKTTESANPTSSKSKEFPQFKNTKKAKKTAALSNPSTKTVTGTNAIISSENNTPVEKKCIFQEDLRKVEDHCSSVDTSTEESMQRRKNPMLLDPIIRCIFGFLDTKDVKIFRFVCREWASAGKQELINRALICFSPGHLSRRPIDFYSCFPNSASQFSSFWIRGPWKIEELSKFFDEQQNSIKELKFSMSNFFMDSFGNGNNFDISPWIAKSPMVKSDVKYLTKLSISFVDCAIPLHLLKHIKDITLAYCRVNLEAGVQIHPVKLSLECIDFYQDSSLSRIQINDIVNFSSAKEIVLASRYDHWENTEIIIDLSGNCRLENLTLLNIEAVNCGTSRWDVRQMRLDGVHFLGSRMTIRELYLSSPDIENDCYFHFCDLPRSIEKLGIGEGVDVVCSEPTKLKKLKYLGVEVNRDTDFSFLAHFKKCRQLTHLKLSWSGWFKQEIELSVIPKAVKTLTLDRCSIDWVYSSCSFANINKIVFLDFEINFLEFRRAKIKVNDIILICDINKDTNAARIATFLGYQKRYSICKRSYIGKFKWNEEKLEDSVLNEHVDVKSAFYVFENGEKGRALDEKSFYQLADIPKHIKK